MSRDAISRLARSLCCSVAVALVGCSSGRDAESHEPGEHHDGEGDSHDERGHDEHERDEHGHDEHGHDEPEAGTLRVNPSMLRDLRLTTTRVQPRSGGETVTLLGEAGVDEDHYGEVGSPIAARVVATLVAPGATVERGAPLVELESVELGRTRAAVNGAQARVALAETTLSRRRQLASDGIAPLREVQEAEAELSAARAELRVLRTTAASLGGSRGRGGSRFVLRAPVAGVVLDRQAVVGRMVEPSDVLFRVGDLARLWITVHAFERDAIRLRTGTSARVTFSALPGNTFDGTLTWLGGRVDPTSRTVPVRVEMPNPAEQQGRTPSLRPGMSAAATIAVGDPNERVLAVPSPALQRTALGWCVFLPRAPGVFEIRAVGRGRDLGSEVEILQGLRAGEEIVVEGAFLLKAEADRAQGGGEEGHEH